MLFILSLYFSAVLLYGINSDRQNNYSGTGFGFCNIPSNSIEADIFKSAGADFVRIDISWCYLEKPDGSWDYSRYDRIIPSAYKNGNKIIFILDYDRPGLHGADDNKRRIKPEEIPAYLNYVEHVVNRWGKYAYGYEIWNEPNHPRFWQGPEKDYFLLAEETGKLLKKIAPESFVAAGSIMYNPWMGGRMFLKKLIKSGALEYADALSIHPYGTWIPDQADRVKKARTLLNKNGYSQKQLWITEIGYPTETMFPYRTNPEDMPYKISEALIRLSASGADIIIWYKLFTSKEAEKQSGAFGGASFGLMYREKDGSYIPKNGLNTWGIIARNLGGSTFAPESVNVSSNNQLDTVLRVFAFRRIDGSVLLALWSVKDSVTVKLKNYSGNFLIINTINGIEKKYSDTQAFRVSGEPLIIKIEKAEKTIAISGAG